MKKENKGDLLALIRTIGVTLVLVTLIRSAFALLTGGCRCCQDED